MAGVHARARAVAAVLPARHDRTAARLHRRRVGVAVRVGARVLAANVRLVLALLDHERLGAVALLVAGVHARARAVAVALPARLGARSLGLARGVLGISARVRARVLAANVLGVRVGFVEDLGREGGGKSALLVLVIVI